MITDPQRRALTAIHNIQSAGEPVFLASIMRELGGKSKTACWHAVNQLVKRGFIKKLPHRHAAIEITPRGHAALRNGACFFRFDDYSKRLVAERAL